MHPQTLHTRMCGSPTIRAIKQLVLQDKLSLNCPTESKDFFKALAIQACLPVLYLGGIVVNMVRLLNIYDHPIMEYSFVYLFVPIPAINPLVSLYLVGPYRVWMRDKFLKWKQSTAKETVVTTATAPLQRGIVAPIKSLFILLLCTRTGWK
ncbi:unnamed protein product [Haemonchus placei]|uniref:Uncharacterized protein n=1 Tax=Haemonchus placei TaxID=6290 RepID=A0A3P7ZQ88_HAEPC|nr:unnamed protein product [Haemonchus placei]